MDREHVFEAYYAEENRAGREYVDKVFNCDDLLLNYLMAHTLGPGVQHARTSGNHACSWGARFGAPGPARMFATANFHGCYCQLASCCCHCQPAASCGLCEAHHYYTPRLPSSCPHPAAGYMSHTKLAHPPLPHTHRYCPPAEYARPSTSTEPPLPHPPVPLPPCRVR